MRRASAKRELFFPGFRRETKQTFSLSQTPPAGVPSVQVPTGLSRHSHQRQRRLQRKEKQKKNKNKNTENAGAVVEKSEKKYSFEICPRGLCHRVLRLIHAVGTLIASRNNKQRYSRGSFHDRGHRFCGAFGGLTWQYM